MPKGSNQESQRLRPEKVREIFSIDENYSLLEGEEFKYRGRRQKLKVLHKSASHIFEISLDSFQAGCRCNICFGRRLFSKESVFQELEKYKDLFTRTSEKYEGCNSKMNFRCTRCGIDFSRTLNDIRNGKRYCPECDSSQNRSLNESSIKKRVKEYKDGSFEFVSWSANEKTVTVKHTPCGSVFKLSVAEMNRKKCCPFCRHNLRKSSGEALMEKVLNELGEKFIPEYKSDALPGSSFDFFLPKYNFLIEYDGTQHFFQKFNCSYSHGTLADNYRRDKKKNSIIENDITLIRVPFLYNTKKKIKEILIKIFEGSTTSQDNVLILKGSIPEESVLNYYATINKNFLKDVELSSSK